MVNTAPFEPREQVSSHYVVAIGASAGGLEAIHTFFDNMTESPNCSFVIIQHLSPDHKSLLVELVGKHTHMKVIEAEHDVKLLKNHVYIIPNNKLITVQKNKLSLADKPPAKVPNNAVDVFLYSLAKEKRELALAVILSGTGTDGTKGIEAIKENGGVVIVQDPATAKFDGMPNSAISSGNVDLVLPPSAIPAEVLMHVQEGALQTVNHTITDEVLEQIFDLIHREKQFDFQYYKTPTLIRRISRRMAQQNFKTGEEYVGFLESNPAECKQLGKDFLIGVTKFFRDHEAFEMVRLKIMPEIIGTKADGEIIQVWVSACSTGEEAYSIAITIDQALSAMNRKLEVKIFATDLDEVHIDIAGRGVYSAAIEKDVSHEVLEKYFVRKGGEYVIHSRIRKQIVFARHNIIKDPPFIKKDFVTCRNMLIYMSPILQQRVYSILLFAMRKNGFLFLGSSESPTAIKGQLQEISSKCKLYQKISDTRPLNYHLSTPERKRENTERSITRKYPEKSETRDKILWEEFERVLADDLNYTAFYIDQNFDLRKAIGNYSKILSLPTNDFRFNLLRMVPAETATILGAEIKKSWKTREKIILKALRLEKENAAGSTFRVVIKPASEDSENDLTLVSFVEVEAPAKFTREGSTEKVSLKQQEYILSLEEDVRELKYNLQLAAEDQETTNEELQSSNEELLSANEELQSSNEELQSLNEELHTLNTEHQLKIRELLELNDDLNNYFRSVDIGQIFLDKDLHIRKFNPVSAKLINFIESDIGRPITHISTNISHDKLLEDVGTVLKKGGTIEKEVQLVNGKNLLMRILPYVTRDKVIAGVVISFVDITTITNLNNIIRGVFNSSQSAILAFQAARDYESNIIDFNVLTANQTAQQMFGNSAEDIKGKSLKKDFPQLAADSMMDNYLSVVQKNKSVQTDLFIPDTLRWLEVSVVKMMDGFVTTFTDVTDKKSAEQRLKKNYVELVTVKENLKKLNTELESKVAGRTRELTLSEERFRLVARATNDALWDWDFVNNTVWWSETFFKMFGYPAENNSFTREEWRSKIHPEDRERVQQGLFDVINSAETQWSQEYRFQKGDGSYVVILDRGYVLHDEHETPYRMLGSMFDLTEQKNAEREIANSQLERKFLAESMPLMVWTTDAEGNINYANSEFESYTGLLKSELMEKGWPIAIFSNDIKVLDDLWKKASQAKEDFHHEVRVLHHSGEYHWNLMAAKARSAQGEFLSWVITLVDIHQQKNVNQVLEEKVRLRTQELQSMNQALERSNYDLQQFASVASHDLQEPLRKIHMFSQRVKEKHLSGNAEAGAFMEKIMQASQRMKALIANVLSFSKLSAEKDHFVMTDLNIIITDLVEDFELAIKEKNAQVTVGELPAVEVIPEQIRQVFQNLLSNALKFSRLEATPVIQVHAKEERDVCTIFIEDNGIGFENEYQETIFQLFERLHSKDKYEGSGIGLAITKKIIEKHKGSITVTSRKGQGTIFEITLPVHQKS